MSKLRKAFIFASILVFMNVSKISVLAGEIANSKVVTGTKKLLNDATIAMGAIGGLTSILLCLYFFIRKNAADEQDQKMWNKRITTSIVCAIGIVVISGFLNTIVRYYK